MELLKDSISAFADHLLGPVLALLAAFMIFAAFEAGAVLREALGRRVSGRRGASGGAKEAGSAATPERSPHLRAWREFQRADLKDAAAAESWIDALARRLTRSLDRTTLVARLAPMLGLAATLIPLGPALRDFGEGRVAGLAENLVVAFSATVAGLVVSGLCHWITAVRTRWYEDDLERIERMAGIPAAA